MGPIKTLFIMIPEVPKGASFEFHPISISQQPKRYRPEDLGDTGTAETPWLLFFEEILMGIYWKTGKPVPYVFKTANGKIRSLDAGCIKWMLNRRPPELKIVLDEDRFIVAVIPSPEMIARNVERREELMARLVSGGKG